MGETGRGPVPQGERIVPIDVLRGFALLGILVMNIQSFAMIDAAYLNPTAYGDLAGANYAVWLGCHVLADTKFISIFSMLFGAGMVLMTGRLEARGFPVARLHYRRMAVLLLFGLVHAYLFWHGDILYGYALCGMVVYRFRHWPPRRLLLLGTGVVAIPSVLYLLAGWSMPFWTAEQLTRFTEDTWHPTAKAIAAELAAYRGGWSSELAERVPTAFFMETLDFATWVCWRAGGLMLVGMALYKLGILTGTRSARWYAALAAAGFALGVPIILFGVQRNFEAGWDVSSLFFGSLYNYWGSLPVSFGWVGLVLLACKSPRLLRLAGPLAAVGRMALTNYLLQTLVCTTLFYGHGFGLFGRLERVEQLGVVVAVWIFQLVLSPLWLRAFRFGPAEWLWRSLTYARLQPVRKGREPEPGAAGQAVAAPL
jgi:uncharacterized protein